MQSLLAETPFQVLRMESKNGMVLIIRVKFVFDVLVEEKELIRVKPKERIIEILTRKLENLDDAYVFSE